MSNRVVMLSYTLCASSLPISASCKRSREANAGPALLGKTTLDWRLVLALGENLKTGIVQTPPPVNV